MTTSLPKARPDLVIRPAELPQGPCWTIEDPARHITYWFGPFEHAVLTALDGERDVAAVLRRIGATGNQAAPRVHAMIAELATAGLLVGEVATALRHTDRLVQVAEDEAYWGQLGVRPLAATRPVLARLDVAPDADCRSCRLPCCSYAIDVAPAETERLVEAALALGVPPAELFAGESSDIDDGQLLRLATRPDRQCVLLDEEGLCRVHATFGLERKPVVCQLYPGHPVVTPDGPRLGLRSGCSRPLRTTAADDRAAYQGALARMAATRPHLPVPHAPSIVRIAGALDVDFAEYGAWEREALRLIESAPSAEEGVLTAAQALRQRFGAPEAGEAGALLPAAGGLSTLLADGGRPREGEVAAALAGGAAAPTPRPCPTHHVALSVDALYPLRFPTVLAGLGVLRLLVACVDRDPDATTRPLEAAAHWFRLFRASSVHLALVRGDAARLEALAAENATL